MRRTARVQGLIVIVVACGLGSSDLAARAADTTAADSVAEAPISWGATYASRYSFQGLDYSEGRPVLQPQGSATLRGFTLTAWGNMDQARHELNEIDLSLEREWALAPLSGALGYTHLRYPHRDWAPTHEVVADFALAALLEPTLSVHWDVAAGAGQYWTLGLSHTLPWHGASMELGSHLYFQDHYYGLTGIPAVETNASATLNWGGVALQPSIARLWTWANGDFRGDQAVRAGWVVGLQCSSR